jgi:hypothetical protein
VYHGLTKPGNTLDSFDISKEKQKKDFAVNREIKIIIGNTKIRRKFF